MKRILKTLFLALTIGIGQSKAEEINGMHYETSGDIVVGEWNTQYAKALAMGTAEGIPVVGFWLRPSCSMCKKIEVLNATKKVIAWRKERGYIFLVGVEGKADASKTLSLTQFGSHLPFVCVWWDKNGDGKPDVHVKWSGRNGDMPVKTGELDEQFMKSIDKYLGSYNPIPANTVGECTENNAENDRLEFDAATTETIVRISRDEKAAEIVTNGYVIVVSGTKRTKAAFSWPATTRAKNSGTEQAVTVTIPAGTYKSGAKLSVYVADASEKYLSTNTITYVELGNSAANPKWLGETVTFGEWTHDLDAAKTLSEAYTLAYVAGTRWCPDCHATEEHFLSSADFTNWAKLKKVGLAVIDVPRFTTNTIEVAEKATMLRRDAYTTSIYGTGLGYLTRKNISDDAADAVLERNRKFVSESIDAAGINSALEDSNPYRTGVPYFVMLRKDGTVAARLTRLATVSPTSAANNTNYLQRLDEMLAIAATTGDHADVTEAKNNAVGAGAIPLAANGGSVTNEFSHADPVDVIGFTGVTGSANIAVEVKGAIDVEVAAQFYIQTNVAVAAKAVGTLVKGKLSSVISLNYTLPEAVTKAYLVLDAKAAAKTDAGTMGVLASASTFTPYTVESKVVYKPGETRNFATAANGKITVELEKGETYCFDGLKNEEVGAALESVNPEDPLCKFFNAKTGGNVDLAANETVGYQHWKPGEVGFAVTSREVTESVCDKDGKPIKIVVNRLGGTSGKVKASVSLKEGESLDRKFTFNQTDLVWEEGDAADKTVDFLIEDDLYWSGTETVTLKLEVLSSDAGDVKVAPGKGEFKLTVTEDDKQSPGRGLFCGVEPFAAKKLTVYAKSSQGATLCVGRVEGADGLVGAELKSSVAGVTFEAEDPRDLGEEAGKTILWWSNRESGQKKIIVKGVPAGKTAKITMAKYQTFGVVSASNTVSVVSVADDAPEFENAQPGTVSLYRYVDASATAAFPVVGTQGGTVSFKKIAGALPSGVKATWDAERKAMVLTGVPTRAGTFTYCCQVSEKRGSKAADGLLVNLKIVVLDPTAPGSAEGGGALNPACAKSRTFSGLPIVDPEARASGKRALFGTLDLTLPATGKASAKIITTDGTISLKAKSWSNADPETGTLSAMLVGTGKNADCTVSVEAAADGKVSASVSSDSLTAMVASDGRVWSKTDSAEAWKGYYTVAMPVEAVSGAGANLAADGSGYLTLKLTTASAWNSGKVTWAGVLPNGAAVSGSATLVRGADVAFLPLAKAKGIDAFTALLAIEKDAKKLWNEGCFRTVTAAQIESEGGVTYDVVPLWAHAETKAKTYTFEAELGAYGALYDASAGLDCCCFSFYETTVMNLLFGMPQSSPAYGALGPVASVPVQVAPKTIKLDTKAANPQKVKFSFSLSTGVVTGSFKLPCENGKEQSARFKGIVLMGWNEPCGCSTDKNLPFINAAWYFTDKVESRGVVRGSSMITDGAAE